MIEAPWLTGEKRGLVRLLLSSHQRAFNRPLMACDRSRQSKRLACQELFACGFPVLAHGTGSDPLITYANSAALHLWGLRWEQLVGMPSRLTAPEEERNERQAALSEAHTKEAIRGYSGTRISHGGRRFQIRDARIWTLWDEENLCCGQAACFSDWWWS